MYTGIPGTEPIAEFIKQSGEMMRQKWEEGLWCRGSYLPENIPHFEEWQRLTFESAMMDEVQNNVSPKAKHSTAFISVGIDTPFKDGKPVNLGITVQFLVDDWRGSMQEQYPAKNLDEARQIIEARRARVSSGGEWVLDPL